MSEDFGIPMTNELSKEVNSMCNFSQGFYDRGYGNGYDNGGINKQVKDIISLMNKLKLSFTEACDLLDIPDNEREEYYARVNNENNPADKDK